MSDRLAHVVCRSLDAARRVPSAPDGHRWRALHGHRFSLRLRAELPAHWAAFAGAETGSLRDALSACTGPIDYSCLNDHMADPSDENLARWLRATPSVPGIVSAALDSSPDHGVYLDADAAVHVWRRYRFESAHRLPNVPPDHKCGRMHGHSFAVVLHARGETGEGVALSDRIDTCWAPLHAAFDHACLNDIAGLENPTSEIIARYVWERLLPALPSLTRITVFETASCGAHYDGRAHRIWKDFSLDSAVQLRAAPKDDPRARIHGHTYTLRLHASAPLDEVRGWAIDFGDIKERFTPTFLLLDHRPLHELAGVADNDPASLARWVRAQIADSLPWVDRIDLLESDGCGVQLSWRAGADSPAMP